MPKIKSAKENLRKDKRRYLSNKNKKEAIRAAVKQLKKIASASETDKAKETISRLYKALDKAAKRGTIKKKAADRKKSRLTKLLYKSFASKTA